jgi:hypothetical protein
VFTKGLKTYSVKLVKAIILKDKHMTKIKYMVDVKSGKGYSSFVKEFNDQKHFDNWYRMFAYKIVGCKKLGVQNQTESK